PPCHIPEVPREGVVGNHAVGLGTQKSEQLEFVVGQVHSFATNAGLERIEVEGEDAERCDSSTQLPALALAPRGVHRPRPVGPRKPVQAGLLEPDWALIDREIRDALLRKVCEMLSQREKNVRNQPSHASSHATFDRSEPGNVRPAGLLRRIYKMV